MSNKISRRHFLKSFAVAAAALGVACQRLTSKVSVNGLAQALEDRVFLPFLSSESNPSPTATSTPTVQPPQPTQPPNPIGPKVVHTHSENATYWDRSDPYYWNYVDQSVVDEMVDQGIIALTSASSVADAWRILLPDYQSGQGIAIKVNFNNSFDCENIDGQIDAIIHPINSMITGLKQIGVEETDIWIFDAIRAIPQHFVNGCVYTNIQYFDRACRTPAGFSTKDPNSLVSFYPPANIPMPSPEHVTDLLVNATYLINMPIMKGHSLMGVSLSFKNHFGSINNPFGLHDYIGLDKPHYSSNYSTLVDLYRHTNIGAKTILTVGDGIFGAKQLGNPPVFWDSFGNRLPNSLFFSTDPVAIDCVLADFLDTELTLPDATYEYLMLASDAGLGTFERGDPWGSGYSQINYQYLKL